MTRGAVPGAREVILPKSELFNAEIGLLEFEPDPGVIVLKMLKTSHRNCIDWLPNRNDRDNPVSTFHRPGPRMASSGIVP